MHEAMINTPMPAMRQVSGLNPPVRAARIADKPKIPAPIMEFTISAVRLHRPMTRTSATGATGDDFNSVEASVFCRCAPCREPCPSVLSHWYRRRFHRTDLRKNVRLTGDAFEMRVTFAVVIIHADGLKIILILHQQLNRLFAVFGAANCFAQNFRSPFAAIHGYELRSRRNARLSRGASPDNFGDFISIFEARIIHAEPQGKLHIDAM